MHSRSKFARDWLIRSSRRSFHDTVREAKITPRQNQIIEMRFLQGMTNYQIAMALNISTKTVEKDIQNAYDAINRILLIDL